MEFKDRMKAAREAAGLNQSEMARRLGLSPQSVQKWESGETIPRGRRMQQVAEVTGVTIAYLMDGGEAEELEVPRMQDASLRDYFATKALQPLITSTAEDIADEDYEITIARMAYRMADAMLNARKI